MSEPIVQISGLTVRYGTSNVAVRDLDLDIEHGETLAIVGESGSGKTTTANAVLGLLAPGATVTAGEIRVRGQVVTAARERTLRQIRGAVIGLIPQDPSVSLNPTMRVGAQVGEAVRRRGDVDRRRLSVEVVSLLERVGLDDPVLRARQYPHQLSGGMRQRVLIAIALAGQPALIIADEPTSALDVTTQRLILDHLGELTRGSGTSLMLITHDLGIAADRADRIAVMQEGLIVERGAPGHVMTDPRSAHTSRLRDAWEQLTTARPMAAETVPPGGAGPPILEFDGVSKDFALPHTRSGEKTFRAIDDLSLSVQWGQTLALVGESGAGKTTALRIALGLESPTAGTVRFDGKQISGRSWREVRAARRRFQYVHQNPFSSLDPRFSLHDSIVEPLVSFGIGNAASRRRRARELIELVSLPESMLGRHPAELSGGERQRVAIARALALGPDLLLLDEPVSALDVSSQAHILTMLGDLQQELGIAYLYVGHNLAVVAQIAHQVAVMQAGVIVEQGSADAIFNRPRTEYTQQLIEAIPGRSPRPRRAAQKTDAPLM